MIVFSKPNFPTIGGSLKALNAALRENIYVVLFAFIQKTIDDGLTVIGNGKNAIVILGF